MVPTAFGLATFTFAGSTVAALLMPKGNMLKYAPILGGGLFLLIGAGFCNVRQPDPSGGRTFVSVYLRVGLLNLIARTRWQMFFDMGSGFQQIMVYGGLTLFTAYNAYDTQNALTACVDTHAIVYSSQTPVSLWLSARLA
jgi:hypothetical protein